MTRKPTKMPESKEDVALLCGTSADGQGVNILRKRGGRVEAGVVRPLEEGKHITGEVVQLKPRGNTPLCDVEVCYTPPPQKTNTQELPVPAEGASDRSPTDRGHPAQVASQSYRKNWDLIWKRSPSKKLLN